MMIHARFCDLLAMYRSELLERVVPFWLKYAVDWEYGGISTCISDEGQVLSTDKYMWSQLRAIWTFSALYNMIEPRPEWLDVAKHIFAFVKKHGRDQKGQWLFAVSKNGEPLQGAISIYTDGFAIYGLTELAKATGNQEAITLALETYESVQRRLSCPGAYGTAPYPLPEHGKAHGVSMLFALAFNELGHYLNDREVIDASLFHANEIMEVYWQPERKMLYEFVSLDNTLIDSPQGRSVVPGHAIESMWFVMHIYQREGNDERVRQAIEILRCHIELGWDSEYGGILLARDAEGQTPWWKFADAKLWWPHTEALYALLLAYEIARAPWCLEWFERVHNYAFTHYPVAKYGEWTQRLDRKGNKFTETVALPVKDPFHLPRALIYCSKVLQRLVDEQ
nr:AGE family epimerase/isomerase [Chloroflexota bacterium]